MLTIIQTTYLGFKSIVVMFEVSAFLFKLLYLGSQLLEFLLQSARKDDEVSNRA
jgi:hypothetical protein